MTPRTGASPSTASTCATSIPTFGGRRITGAFQDFVRFKFGAEEAVGVGVGGRHGGPRVVAAATAGGAAPFLERLPAGYATQLGRDFPDGADLSEGQWQKVALSRALMRPEPLLVVLDEPTAALDARAEHARYAAEAVDSRRRGSVTLLVSHRFSTVRMADLIVVLDHGRILEVGTHARASVRRRPLRGAVQPSRRPVSVGVHPRSFGDWLRQVTKAYAGDVGRASTLLTPHTAGRSARRVPGAAIRYHPRPAIRATLAAQSGL